MPYPFFLHSIFCVLEKSMHIMSVSKCVKENKVEHGITISYWCYVLTWEYMLHVTRFCGAKVISLQGQIFP